MKNALIVYMQKNSRTLAEVKRVLKNNKVSFTTINRINLRRMFTKKYDLVITVGGDGTFLRTSHFLFCKTPILGINADPSRKEGFFTRADKGNFEILFSKKLKIRKLSRLEVKINKKIIPDYPLNEIFVGHYKPYQMSFLDINNHSYRCSGVLVSTPAGSYSWSKSAGASPLPLFSDKFQYIVLDPYEGNIYKPKHPYKVLKKNEVVTIIPYMPGCIAVMDSLSREYHLKKGDMITVRRSDHPLMFVDGFE